MIKGYEKSNVTQPEFVFIVKRKFDIIKKIISAVADSQNNWPKSVPVE